MINLIGQIAGKTVANLSAKTLRNLFPNHHTIVTTDFVVTGKPGKPILSPDGQLLGFRYVSGGAEIISIDHHGPDPRMQRFVSSTNLALEFVRAWGTVDAAAVTHTDYDSVVAAAILTGRLPLHLGPLLGPAAIFADHTGKENVHADTLQAIQDRRDIEFSLMCLQVLLQQGEENLPPVAREALQARRAQRAEIQSLVQAGVFQHRGAGVYAGYLNTRVDGELLPALLKEAVVIITISPPQKAGDGSVVKTRLGMAAPEGMSFLKLGLKGLGWDGRWNAGSTGRHGGTHDPEAFIAAVCSAVKRY